MLSVSAQTFQFLQNVVALARAVIVGEAGEGFGENFVMVQILQAGLARDVEPQTMEQEDVFVRCQWAVVSGQFPALSY